MRSVSRMMIWCVVLCSTSILLAQPDRIQYNHQRLFLSGSNLAWLNFGRDVGYGPPDTTTFAQLLLSMHDCGGNSLRWWIHADGRTTPAFDGSGNVTGPGEGAISGLRRVLDLAWEREIGVNICLWSFDMLRSSNSSAMLGRNLGLLTDTTATQTYIAKCLIPMVDSLKGHPGILSWEIFNEPEGMSDEFGWSGIVHVPMSVIQRFVNRCAGAIHRRDPAALVTNGAWSFKSLTDVPAVAPPGAAAGLGRLSASDLLDLERFAAAKYRITMPGEEIALHLQRVNGTNNYNYYSDSRLVAAGGDPNGTLDFYSVHYYDWAGTALSPLHHPWSMWGLNKPLVVAEFALKNTLGVPMDRIYDTLYQQGYAGALAWAWTDTIFSRRVDILASMQQMWDAHRTDVDVLGIGGDWPSVRLTSPAADTAFAEGADVLLAAEASDKDGTVTKVQFFRSDTTLLGETLTAPYSVVWHSPPTGNHKLTARATDNQGHQRISLPVAITVGKPLLKRLEAEGAARTGTPAPISDPTASGGACLRMQQTGTITWTVPYVPSTGTYKIVFGFRLTYDHPKTQFLNVNGQRVANLVFDGAMNAWLEKEVEVTLLGGSNAIQVELSWGWMDIDYLAVPASFFVTDVAGQQGLPGGFHLEQNSPNPFNGISTIEFSIPEPGWVELKVHDLLGREVATVVRERLAPGRHAARFEAQALASGVYLYTLRAGDRVQTRKMILVR